MLPTSRRLTLVLAAVALIGVAALVVGTVENYGPAYTFGGIFVGFALGMQMCRSTVRQELERYSDTAAVARRLKRPHGGRHADD